jgi:hypothetical protein
MRAVMRAAQKAAWLDVAKSFAANNVPQRFTSSFASEANYSHRSGQELPRGSKQFWRSYFGRKIRKFGHADPFVWSGDTRRAARVATVSSTSNGASIRLPGTGRINYKPKYAAEFRRIIPREANEIGKLFDARLDVYLRESRSNG